MDDVKYLKIQGYLKNDVPNAFWPHPRPTGRLAISFPGFGYTADMPVLYYPAFLARDRGFDLLQLKTNYSTNAAYQQATGQEQLEWIMADARASLQAGLAQGNYPQLLLIGKSLGTIAISRLIDDLAEFPRLKILWLTPVLTDPIVTRVLLEHEIPGLVVIGKSDPYYDPNRIREMESKAYLKLCVYDSANHSLEIPGDMPGSIRILADFILSLDTFIFQ